MRTLSDRVVVITGAASGIGRAIALEAARHGALLALCDVDADGLVATGELVHAATGSRPRLDVVDVSDRAAVVAYAASLASRLGRVNVLVNNAGIALHGELVETSYAQLDRVLAVDLHAVVDTTKAFLPHLLASGEGHVVNVSSAFGLVGMGGQTAYVTAKFGVRGFSEALRVELLAAGHPVAVTCVHPGGVRTSIVRNAVIAPGQDRAALTAMFDRRIARTSPEDAADRIVRGVLRDRPRVLVGRDAWTLDLLARVLGPGYQRLFATVLPRIARRGRLSL